MKSGSRLEKVLAAGHFAVTGECGPPRGADGEVVRKKAQHLKGVVKIVFMAYSVAHLDALQISHFWKNDL